MANNISFFCIRTAKFVGSMKMLIWIPGSCLFLEINNILSFNGLRSGNIELEFDFQMFDNIENLGYLNKLYSYGF